MKKLVLFVSAILLTMFMSSCIILFDSGSATLRIINDSSTSIYYVYWRESGYTDWGYDQLGSQVVSTGETVDLTITPGTYDLKAEDSSHNVVASIQYSVTFADGDVKEWTFYNN